MTWQEKAQIYYDRLEKEGYTSKFNRAGVYSISFDNKIVYVGKSRDMMWRIASHMAEIEADNPTQNKYKVLKEARRRKQTISFNVIYATDEVDQAAIDDDIGQMEGFMIRQIQPPLNYQIPNEDNYHSFTINNKAKTITYEEIVAPIDGYKLY